MLEHGRSSCTNDWHTRNMGLHMGAGRVLCLLKRQAINPLEQLLQVRRCICPASRLQHAHGQRRCLGRRNRMQRESTFSSVPISSRCEQWPALPAIL